MFYHLLPELQHCEVLCSYCYFHFSLLPELEGDGQSGNAQERGMKHHETPPRSVRMAEYLASLEML